jgi:hypothetical protein
LGIRQLAATGYNPDKENIMGNYGGVILLWLVCGYIATYMLGKRGDNISPLLTSLLGPTGIVLDSVMPVSQISTILAFLLGPIGIVAVLVLPVPKISAEYFTWRNLIFGLKASKFAELGVEINDQTQVLEVFCDLGITKDFCISIMSLINGETSLRSTTGGGMLNLGATPEISDLSKQIVQLANTLIDKTEPASINFALPPEGQVVFFFLTKTGIQRSAFFGFEALSGKADDPFNQLLQNFMLIKGMTDEMMKNLQPN